MKRLIVALAGLTALTSTAAQAAPTITYDTDPSGSFSAIFGNTPKVVKSGSPAAYYFEDYFTPFTITMKGVLAGSISTSGLAPKQDLDFSLAEILGPNGLKIPFPITKTPKTGTFNGNPSYVNPDGSEEGDIQDTLIGPGTYMVHVKGTVTTAPTTTVATYSGNLSFVPAPEPAAWALMIIGFGAVGFAMRRQRSTYRIAYS